jgi:hypothetical protein
LSVYGYRKEEAKEIPEIKYKMKILDSVTSGMRVAKIEFDQKDEGKVKEALKRAGFDVESRYRE